MIIAGLQKLTLIDYPGKLGATVFLAGCNFRCPWCYSSELVLPEKIKNQPEISQKEFFSFLKERQGLLEGIIICGGEPTLNSDLPDFIKKIKKLGFLVKLDTNGSNPKMLKKLIDDNSIDYVAMDIKWPLGPKSKIQNPKSQIISKSQILKYKKEIRESVEILKQNKIDSEFRTTVIPEVLDKIDILEIAQWIGGSKVKYYLQNFRPEKTIDPKFEKIKPYPDKYLIDIQKSIAPFFKTCKIR